MNIIRGDTAKFKFQRLDANGEPILIRAQRIYFTVKLKYTDAAFILQKTIDDMTFDNEGFYHFVIEPSDTDNLMFGDYVYDIEVITDEYKQTISLGKLALMKEVTHVGNEG